MFSYSYDEVEIKKYIYIVDARAHHILDTVHVYVCICMAACKYIYICMYVKMCSTRQCSPILVVETRT